VHSVLGCVSAILNGSWNQSCLRTNLQCARIEIIVDIPLRGERIHRNTKTRYLSAKVMVTCLRDISTIAQPLTPACSLFDPWFYDWRINRERVIGNMTQKLVTKRKVRNTEHRVSRGWKYSMGKHQGDEFASNILANILWLRHNSEHLASNAYHKVHRKTIYVTDTRYVSDVSCIALQVTRDSSVACNTIATLAREAWRILNARTWPLRIGIRTLAWS